MLAGPVVDVIAAAERAGQLAHHVRRREQVGELEPQPGDVFAHPVQPRRVVDVDVGEIAVELVHAGVEDADDFEAAHARHDARRRHGAQRRDDHDAIAHADAERLRQLVAEHDAELAGRSAANEPASDFVGDDRDLSFVLRQHAGDDRAAALAAAREQQRLLFDERCSGRAPTGYRAPAPRCPASRPGAELSALMLACEVRLRMRPRTSRSKPFITESTTMSTATPIAMPAIEIVEMKETKRLPRLARR